LSELENIEEDVKKQKILFAKTTDSEFAASNGLENLPALIFFKVNYHHKKNLESSFEIFKNKIPNLYEGDLNAGEEVFNWLIEMKVESRIELVTRPMLEIIVTKAQYLAVLFYKQNCRTCDQIIKQIENINSECDNFGIQLVKIKDPQFAKRYGIRTFPALVYFRNGRPITFEGDLKIEKSVMEWLTDDDNRYPYF